MIAPLLFAIIFLIGSISLSSIIAAIRKIGYTDFKEALKRHPTYFFVFRLIQKQNLQDRLDAFVDFIGHTQQIVKLCFGVSGAIYLISEPWYQFGISLGTTEIDFHSLFLVVTLVILVLFTLIIDFFTHIITSLIPHWVFRVISWIAYLFILLFYPITFLVLKVQKRIDREEILQGNVGTSRFKQRLLELLDETESEKAVTAQEQNFLIGITNLHSKSCREVMVPRVNVCTINEQATLKEALDLFVKENYSRLPVVHLSSRSSVDEIIGFLYIKDLIKAFASESESHNQKTIKSLIRPVLFAPETKKVTLLLKDFQKKQIHLAVIVDEYGGMEGIVTFEDILEEIVGEIFDEYDEEEKNTKIEMIDENHYIIDASLNLLDIEEQSPISFPTSFEYDTLSGLIYHISGTIPEVGCKIFLNQYELEVIKGNDRMIEKVKVTFIQSS